MIPVEIPAAEMPAPELALAMLGAGAGAASRWLLDQAIVRRVGNSLPWGTFTINVSGALLLGVILGFASTRTGNGVTALVALVGTGFCGGFTTFSTFTFETVRLAEQGRPGRAAGYLISSLGAGLLAAYLGWGVGLLAG